MEELYALKDSHYFSRSRPEMIDFVPAGVTRVLDVGCGSGNFGQLLKTTFKCEVWGIEPDSKSAAQASEKLDFVIADTFDRHEILLETDKFDCIFFNDVLEHMPQPEPALELAHHLLTPDGHIVASIPNIRFYPVMLSLLRYKDFKYQDAGVMDRTHLRFFTRKSMIRLFEENTFQVKKINGIDKNNFPYLKILNRLLLNNLEDMQYPQFGILAQKRL